VIKLVSRVKGTENWNKQTKEEGLIKEKGFEFRVKIMRGEGK